MKILAVQMNPTIGDVEGNTERVIEALKRAKASFVDVVVFPELTLCGYPPEDLLLDPSFIEALSSKLPEIAPWTQGMFVAVGVPRENPTHCEKPLYNSAAIFSNGQLLGFKHKTLLCTYDVFDERRFFEPGKAEPVWEHLGRRIGVTICEDLWEHAHILEYTHYKIDPVEILKKEGVDLVLNLSASPYYFEREKLRLSIFTAAAKTLECPIVMCNQVGANDQLVFDGNSFYLNEKGELLQKGASFEEEDLFIDLEPHACPCSNIDAGMENLYKALVLGVKDYFRKQGFQKAILGLSGGIDSAVTACIAVEALGKENLTALYLPMRYSSRESAQDSWQMAENLHIAYQSIDIDPMFQEYLDLLRPHFGSSLQDITEQNLQARIRGMVLMAFSNQTNSLLLHTGNKTEMAMGYTTLYGDLCGGLGVLQDVVKLRVYQLAAWINRQKPLIPESILTKPASAELKLAQKTTEALHPFEILDPVIEDYIEKRLLPDEIARSRNLPLDLVQKWVHQIHLNEYKRRQAPISIRVTAKSFSKGRNVPIVQVWR